LTPFFLLLLPVLFLSSPDQQTEVTFQSELRLDTDFPPYFQYFGQYQRADISLSSFIQIQPNSIYIRVSLLLFDRATIIQILELPDGNPSLGPDGRVSFTFRVDQPSTAFDGVPFVLKIECVDPSHGIAPCYSTPFHVLTQVQLAAMLAARARPTEPRPAFDRRAPIIEEPRAPINFRNLYLRRDVDLKVLCRDTNHRVRNLQKIFI
jgi:hypothetical protein